MGSEMCIRDSSWIHPRFNKADSWRLARHYWECHFVRIGTYQSILSRSGLHRGSHLWLDQNQDWESIAFDCLPHDVEYHGSVSDLPVVPLRSPITRGARSARCGSSSLRRVVGGAPAYGISLKRLRRRLRSTVHPSHCPSACSTGRMPDMVAGPSHWP